MPSDLSDEILERVLAGRLGRYRRVYDSIDSTNLDGLRWAAEEGAPEGALVVADAQHAGRGRWGRSWLSEPGRALMFSVVLRPGAEASPGLLTTAAGVAVASGVERCCGLETAIEWPNDVLLNDRKVSGILVESRSIGRAVGAAVVGVGVNLHWRRAELPAEIAGRATSIAAEVETAGAGRVPGRAELLAAILLELDHLYALLATKEGAAEVLGRATSKSAIVGTRVALHLADGSRIEGVVASLSASGGLLLDDGRVITSGEVERLGRP